MFNYHHAKSFPFNNKVSDNPKSLAKVAPSQSYATSQVISVILQDRCCLLDKFAAKKSERRQALVTDESAVQEKIPTAHIVDKQ